MKGMGWRGKDESKCKRLTRGKKRWMEGEKVNGKGEGGDRRNKGEKRDTLEKNKRWTGRKEKEKVQAG